jgi:DNA-binding transcriptional MocR family regulator
MPLESADVNIEEGVKLKISVPIQLEKSSQEPLYMQLYREFKTMVEKGILKQGEKLPPIRKMAEYLGVNNSTVISAYNLLESSGYAYSRTGSGTYVMSRSQGTGRPSGEGESSIEGIGEIRARRDAVNFADSSPDPGLLNVEGFKHIIDEVLDRDGGEAFGYTDIRGYRPLRERMAEYMENSGVFCGPDSIQVISGAQQGIDIIAKVLIDYGDLIMTERPTYAGAIAVFKSRGARIADIAIGENGMDMEELEDRLKEEKPKFIYITSNFQNPTGYSYSRAVRERLLLLAQRDDFYIIEDDYLSELYYSGERPASLKSMDTFDRVVYIKSFSKVFLPGMRLGFLVVPEKVRNRVAAAKQLSDISTSGFLQRVFELYIRKNMLEGHLKNVRDNYSERYRVITGLLDSSLGEVEYYKSGGGIHLWLRLPAGMSSNMLYSQGLMENVIISPGSSFFMNEMDSRYFRLSYASAGVENIIKGIGILGDIIRDLGDAAGTYHSIPAL